MRRSKGEKRLFRELNLRKFEIISNFFEFLIFFDPVALSLLW